jgi:GH25 family lysozyme M1 (1,4-beta-N-acetylmuramidase)
MTAPQFVDVSSFQGNIDFMAYAAWSRQWDGIARMAVKATEGTGFIDPHFQLYRQSAIDAGVDVLLLYHFARPDLNSAVAEANFMHSVVGGIRDSDLLILDYEQNTNLATATWAFTWLATQEANYGKLPGIYASTAYIRENLQLNSLSRFKLWLADWRFTPDERPPVPFPWSSYEFVQFTDKATNVPGVPGVVDCNIFLGKETPMSQVPSGWSDDGTTLKAPDGTPVTLGFRDHILNSNWDPNNIPLEQVQHLTAIELSNPSLGDGQAQTFRWKRLEYTPKTGVFEGWLGQELVWYQKDVKALNAQLATSQGEITALKALIASSNLGQISVIGKQISDDIALIMKLSQVQ